MLALSTGGFVLILSQCQWGISQGRDSIWCAASVVWLVAAIWVSAVYIIPGLARGEWGFWIGVTGAVITVACGVVVLVHAYLPDQCCGTLTAFVYIACAVAAGGLTCACHIMTQNRRPRVHLLDTSTQRRPAYGSTATGPNVRDRSERSDHTGAQMSQLY